jgi:hypothetical protein
MGRWRPGSKRKGLSRRASSLSFEFKFEILKGHLFRQEGGGRGGGGGGGRGGGRREGG